MEEVAAHVPLTASGAVKGKAGALVGVILTAGVDAASVTLYDNPSAGSGTKLCVLKAAIGATVVFPPCVPYAFGSGCYATITGTTPDVTVVFL